MKKKTETQQQPPELIAELIEKLQPTVDIIQIPLHIEDKQAFLFYLKSVVDADKIQQMIIKPFFEMSSQEYFETYLNLLPDKIELPTKEKLLISLTKGSVLVAIKDQFVLLDLKMDIQSIGAVE